MGREGDLWERLSPPGINRRQRRDANSTSRASRTRLLSSLAHRSRRGGRSAELAAGGAESGGAVGLDRFPRAVTALPHARPDFLGRSPKNLEADPGVGVFPDHGDERPFGLMLALGGETGGEGVPLHCGDAVEQPGQGQQIELEGDGAHLTIFAAADQFGLAEIHRDLPAFHPGTTLEAHAAQIDERFEEFSNAVNEVGEPRGAGRAGLLVFGRFDLPDQVLQGEMRMTHVDASPRGGVSGGAGTCLQQVCIMYREVEAGQ